MYITYNVVWIGEDILLESALLCFPTTNILNYEADELRLANDQCLKSPWVIILFLF